MQIGKIGSLSIIALLTLGSLAMAQGPTYQTQYPTEVNAMSPAGLWGHGGTSSTYRILPRTDPFGRTVPSAPTPTLSVRPIQPYSYGWFGTHPSPAFSRSFGNRQAYTQWSLK